MVKNKTGGKNAKRGARKNMNTPLIPRRLRFIENDDELYGIVTKILGCGQINVLCNDNKERLCMIRNKFSGRNKSSNLITIGSWCIIGLRSWETSHPGKMEKCDLLEIYNHQEKTQLIQDSKTNLIALLKHEQNGFMNEDNYQETNHIEFTYDNNDIIENNNEENEEEENIIDDIDFDEI